MKFSAILATIVLAACATAIALPEPMAPVQHLDMEARSPTPVIKQTSRDEILQRNQLRATRTKERRDGSALPYPACDPNQPVTGTVWATFAGHDVSGNVSYMATGHSPCGMWIILICSTLVCPAVWTPLQVVNPRVKVMAVVSYWSPHGGRVTAVLPYGVPPHYSQLFPRGSPLYKTTARREDR